VYRIVNLLDGKCYVGVSSRYNIWDRWQVHCTNLQSSLIGAAIIKDGVHNFNFEVLEVCATLQELSEAEKKWIAYYKCMNPYGYNRTPGGLDGILHISQESRMKAGRKRRGELHPLAKLSDKQVAEIQKSGLDAWDVAMRYGISRDHARALVLGYRRVLANK
jgi:group I intron endonuclease